jgi:methylase of polypeptide subunit release factors
VESLQNAKIITPNPDGKFRATIRVSNFYLPTSDIDAAPLYYIHSSFPAASDAVFFGPDTYLFVSFLQTIKRHFSRLPKSIIDVCCGSGAGAIHLARTFPWANVIGLDLNARALQLGGVNAHLADVTVEFHKSNLYDAVPDTLKSSGVDLIVSNPPYIASSSSGEDLPIYADGGAGFGLNMSLRIVEEGLKILKEKGILVVYAGVAIPIADPGRDAFLKKLESFEGAELVEYTILHPDMWPEEIGHGTYAGIGRIQVVGAVLRKK